MVVALLAASALAQSVTLDAGNALEAAPGTFYESGLSAPTVAWDESQGRYIMFFETKLGDADAVCNEGYWGLGVAHSLDGYSWEVWPDPVVTPTAGTAWSCYAAHPAVVLDDTGTYHLWFKAGQRSDACAGVAPAWGCALQPGIGKVSGVVQVETDKADEIAALEADLVLIDDAIDAEMVAIGTAVDDFLGYLETNDGLDCVDYDDVCTPCESLTLRVSRLQNSVGDSVAVADVCQTFDFVVPSIMPVLEGSAGKNGFAYVKFGTDVASSSCRYKGTSNLLLAPYTQEIAVGQCTIPVGTNHIELVISRANNTFAVTTAEITLSSTNAQSLQGPGVDTLVALSDAAAAGDSAAVLLEGDLALTVLANLRAQLAALPVTADRTDLDAEAAALEALLSASLAEIATLQAERDAILAELDALYAYTPTVDMNPVQNGPSLATVKSAYPSVTLVGGTWTMQVAYRRNLWTATSTDGENFTLGAAPSVQYGTVSWSLDELFTPALTCGDSAGPERNQSVYGGRDTSNNVPGGAIVEGGLGDAISADLVTWFSNIVAWVTWTNSTEWRHFDVLHNGSELRFWTSEIDPGTGLSVVRTGSTGPVASTGGTGRVCD